MENISNTLAINLYHFVLKHKHLKLIESDTPFSHILLNDIQTEKRRFEDELFLYNDDIFQKIRRGLCIAEFTHDKSYHIARKGLPKFFDIKRKFSNSSDDKKTKYRVLSPIWEAFKQNKGVQVYLSEKANGENVQLAYDLNIGAWIIGSKNVTIAVNNEKDINYYLNKDKTRYNFAIEFAQLWFEILNKKIKSQGDDILEQFKKDISGYTLVGENVGDLMHQHIKIYPEKDIIFYSMVKNDSEELCIPLEQSYKLLHEKYGLSYVKITKSDVLYNEADLQTFIEKTYEEILLQNVDQGGEGTVAYFAILDTEEEAKETVITLGKFKTFEYRFLRKLREKLKSFISKHSSPTCKSIEKECQQFLIEDGDEVNMQQHLQFAQFVIDYVTKSNTRFDFQNKYAIFISQMKAKFDTKKTVETTSENNIISTAKMDIEQKDTVIEAKGKSMDIDQEKNLLDEDEKKQSLLNEEKDFKHEKKSRKNKKKKHKELSSVVNISEEVENFEEEIQTTSPQKKSKKKKKKELERKKLLANANFGRDEENEENDAPLEKIPQDPDILMQNVEPKVAGDEITNQGEETKPCKEETIIKADSAEKKVKTTSKHKKDKKKGKKQR